MARSRDRRNRKKPRKIVDRPQETSPLPEYLLQKLPLPSSIPSPVQTRQQELPFEKLSWEYFEHLCKDLVETDHEIRYCRLYGRRGQKQKGIDLIAFPRDFQGGRPRVYQCKRVENFRQADIRGAVARFRKSKWRPLPTHFVLCCRSSLRSTEYQDEIVKQTTRLQKCDIVFEIWDADELSKKLKDHPRIVDEYFDRHWVRAFNGPEAVEALERRFEPSVAGFTDRSDQVERLLLSKDLENQSLKSALDMELSQTCDQIRERYTQGRQSEALRDLQSYIDRFQTDLHAASPAIRAKFWYTVGVLNWKLPSGRKRAQQCLEDARQIDSKFDFRPLEARILFATEQYEEALRVLQPIDTLPVFTLSLAILLDLGRLNEFDAAWSTSTIRPDDVAYQLLAYRHRLDRRFDRAQDAIKKAIDQDRMVPAHHVAAGHITFWEAVPEHLDEAPRSIPPGAFHPLFYRPTDRQARLLDKAVESYNQAISCLSGVSEVEAVQIREMQGYRLLCLAYHPYRQSQATQLALLLLDEDPLNFSALFYCAEWDVPFNVDRSIHALETKRCNGDVMLNDVYMLTKLYDLQDQTDRAIHLLEIEQERFSKENARYLWIESMVELLVKRGNTSEAAALLETYQRDDPVLKPRLEAYYYDRLGDQRTLEDIAVPLYERSGAMLDLLNLCGFFRKTEQWGKLEPYASQLVDRSPDPGSVSLLTQALYHNRKFEECLGLLEKHAGLFLEAKLPDDLRRIEIECLFKLNRPDKAVTHLEAILRERPSSSVVQNLAHAYFRMGKREKVVALLRGSSEAPWADTTVRLAASQLLLRESPEEAFRLAQRVKDESPGDPRAWLHYIQTGFLTGHDREASETLLAFQGRFPETPLLQRVGLEDLMERASEWRKGQLERWNLYRSARLPIHIFIDAERQALGIDWSIRFHSNKLVIRWDQKYPLFVRYGGRPPSEIEARQLDTQAIIVDYTALLIAHELNLLPLVERVFPRILIPPSLLAVVQMEVQKAAENQPSRLQVHQQVKSAMDAERIHVMMDSAGDDGLRRFQVGDLGVHGARLFCLAERYCGLVLAKHLLREEERRCALDEPLAAMRVHPHEVLTALYRLGTLAQHELSEATKHCRDEPCREEVVQALAQRPLLITDELTMGFFADLGLLERLTGTFRVSMPAAEAETVTQALQGHQLRQSRSDWLDGLRRYVSERLNQHYYFPSFPVDIDKEDQQPPCTGLLQDVFRSAQIERLPVWIDDRFAHQYERIEQSQILGTNDILALLKSKGLLSDEEHYRYLLRLMELNALFLPLDPEIVLYFLRSAGIGERGEVRETYELKTIRRYFAGAFAEGTALGFSPPGPGKLPESVLYYQQHQSACRALLLKVWSSSSLSDDQKKTLSDWIVGRLWRGMEEISHLLPNPPTLSETVALSQFLLMSVAFDILFQQVRTVDLSSEYLCWLYDRFINAHWASNPEVKRLVIKRLVGFFKSMTEGRQERFQKGLLALSASLLVKAPSEIVEALFSDDAIQVLFKNYLHRTLEIAEELKVPAEECRQWAFECISLGAGATVEKNCEGRLLSLQWNEPSPFLPGLRIQFVSTGGTQSTYTGIDSFIKLYHPSPETRRQALDTLLPFLYVSATRAAELKERLATQAGWELAAAEVEAVANSSWRYFWGRLADLIQARIPTGVDLLFPTDPTTFVTRFPLSAAAMEDPSTCRTEWPAIVQRRLETDGFEVALTYILAFPFGEGTSSSEVITRLIDSGNITRSQALEEVLKFATRTTNPMALQNCLDILLILQAEDVTTTDDIQIIVRKLLDPEGITDPTPLAPLYELYITALHFAWSRMQTLESFGKYSVQERIVWTYAYAGGLMDVLEGLWKDQNTLFDYATFSKWLTEKIEPSWKSVFEGSYNEQLEVSHPVKASHLRTIVSGTLGILFKHKNKLRWLSTELLEKSIFIARQAIQGAIGGAEEIFKPFGCTMNFFGAPFDRNLFSNLKEIFECFDEDASASLKEPDRHLVQFIRGFDPNATLSTTLHRIANCKAWDLNGLVSIYIALGEPLDPSLVETLRQAVAHLDLSRWPEEREFAFACLTIAQCAHASNSPEVRNDVIEKLTDAWVGLASQTARYIAILNAAVAVISNSDEEDKASEFYRWWRGAIETMKGQVPEEVYEIVVSLAWRTPITQQQGLSGIRSRLAVLF